MLGGLGDETLPHLPWPEFSFGVNVNGPEEMRKAVRMFLKYGVDSIKLNLSGDNFVPGAPAETTWMSDEEVAIAVKETKMRGKRVSAHARSCESIKQCVRHGIEVIYHASFTDNEALDMLEANKDKHFVAPGMGILIAMLEHATPYGITRQKAIEMGYEIELAAAAESLKKMHRRGIRVLPGGDYGFAFTPHCDNARDLEYFVKYLGFTPMEAILSATKHGAAIMMRDGELGQVKEGYLADLLLVDGDPLANLAILRDKARMLCVMKDGEFYQEARGAIVAGALGAVGGIGEARRMSRFWTWFWILLIGVPLAVFVVWAIADNTRLFFVTTLNGLTLAALYFLVASGFTLVFVLLRPTSTTGA